MSAVPQSHADRQTPALSAGVFKNQSFTTFRSSKHEPAVQVGTSLIAGCGGE